MDLIDLLAKALELEYISLLPVVRVSPERLHYIYELPEDGACTEDYVRLAQYVRCEDTNFKSIQEAKRRIAQTMGGRPGGAAGR